MSALLVQVGERRLWDVCQLSKLTERSSALNGKIKKLGERVILAHLALDAFGSFPPGDLLKDRP